MRDSRESSQKGNYGAGTVMVWDTGQYQSIGKEPLEAWKEGKLNLHLEDKNLKGMDIGTSEEVRFGEARMASTENRQGCIDVLKSPIARKFRRLAAEQCLRSGKIVTQRGKVTLKSNPEPRPAKRPARR